VLPGDGWKGEGKSENVSDALVELLRGGLALGLETALGPLFLVTPQVGILISEGGVHG